MPSTQLAERPSSPAVSPGASPTASPRQGIRHSATAPLSVNTTAHHNHNHNADAGADAHSPTTPGSPGSPGSEQTSPREKRHRHTLAGAARAVMLTQSWKPGITRANSWTPEDRKRSVQMSGLMEEEIPEGYSQYSER